MDWKYILSLNVDDLKDDEKDELYNTVTWFDCEGVNLEENKYKALVRACQEILKYKGEQVETLLHELEEMTVKQAEDEAKKQESEADLRSSKSRKSSSLEYENLEQKYLESRSKLKKMNKLNEQRENEIQKLNNKLKLLEQENRRLQNEVQSRTHYGGGSESDISESIKDKQKELVETLHNKNRQISDLLRDIEDVEKENSVLRDKLSKVRDDLSVATEEIVSLTDILKEKESIILENKERMNDISSQIEVLKDDFESLQKEKVTLEEEMKNTIEDLSNKLKDVQDELISKEDEIQNLKARLKEPSLNSSLSSLPKDEPEKEQSQSQSHLTALQRVLNDREKQLIEIQTQLQIATKEMEEVTGVLTKLKSQKKDEEAKVKDLSENNLELKKQLKSVHDRCQKLHDDISFAEETMRSKDEELKHILDKMQENGQVDLAINLNAIKELKTENKLKEKQIISLVKATNKLQETCDLFEKENSTLRETLGIPEEENINISSYNSKQKRFRKEIEYLKHQLSNKEETSLQLKTEVHKLNKTVSSLTDQILELGHKPAYETKFSEPKEKFQYSNDEMKALVEENEALRKGLHEIMNSIKARKSQLEIKSETFEKMLRALDVKHITGWYHPAMRLQAELHNLEGVNSELREQLRLTRNDIKLKKTKDKDEETQEKDEIDTVTADSGIQIEETISENVEETVKNLFNTAKVDKKINLDFIHHQVLVWIKNLASSNNKLLEEVESSENKLKILEEEHAILLEKLKILIAETDEEKVKKINDVITTNVKLNRKVVFLENECKKLSGKIENFEKDFNAVEKSYMKSLTEIQNRNKILEASLNVAENLNSIAVNFEAYKELENNLNNITLKYRELAANIQKQEENKSLEFNILIENQKSLETDKKDLLTKLERLKTQDSPVNKVKNFADKEEKLAQKIADAEIKEITERQRANHINNLYELVKEQLNKSEERFKEYSKFNEELLKKNLTLQEQLKDFEEKLCDYVDRTSYNQLRNDNNDLVKECEQLTIKINYVETELKLTKRDKDYEKTWSDSKEQELLNLKHQIVDLVSISDDKVIIAQLSGDVLQNRKLVEFYKISLNGLNEELEKMIETNEEAKKKFEEGKYLLEEREMAYKKKIDHLQNLIRQQRLQFYGYVPLTSEEIYINNIEIINKQKHETFLVLQKAKELENETTVLREKLNLELEFSQKQKKIGTDSYKEEYKKMSNWMQEKKAFQISELRLKRQSEYKESQLQHYIDRVKIQDEQITKLDQELLQIYKNFDSTLPQKLTTTTEKITQEEPASIPSPSGPVPLPRKITRSVSIQASEPDIKSESSEENGVLVNLKNELLKIREDLSQKESQIDQLKSKLTEHEMTISMFRKQIGDKQSQISFYERHIMELQNKKTEVANGGAGGDNINVRSDGVPNEETLILKNSLKTLQENIKAKDEELIKYQTLLKIDRDKHSLAAATLQEELQNLQKQLAEEKQNVKSLEETYATTRPNRAALEQYIAQVHGLEKHTSELHTKLTSLEAQLQSSRQEAVRWRTMANDRLTAMEELRNSLDQQHQNELELYKSDTEKLKEIGNDEINSLRQIVLKQKGELTGRLDSDIQRLIREKDDKIHEMIVKLRQMKYVKKPEPLDLDLPSKKVDLESAKEILVKENEFLRQRYEQTINREKIAREEINNLKFQLLKKPISARSDKSDKSAKEQLQKKISCLEKDIFDLKHNLNEQIAINETHKIQASEDFNKWKKMKHWQQVADKLKNKLKERDVDFEKLQQTSAGYRLLIERLERDKRNLENRVKTLKSSNINPGNMAELESLKLENMKLLCDLSALQNKMEMQQHHAGTLGATMLEEKLEGQERKIAILELATKGTSELRSELERLQMCNSTFQKSNLRLEAENLDLKLDLEKSNKEVPHLQQQIQHLENYVDLLKSENTKQQADVKEPPPSNPEMKKVSELERTVFILKRVVEKLQTENKRLVSGKRPVSDRSPSGEKLKRDFLRLKEQHAVCAQKIEQLEKELEVTKNTMKNISSSKKDDGRIVAISRELTSVKEQLDIKSGLLDKVKVLLHRAAAKEKTLLQEITELKHKLGQGISPIPEESEKSSLSDTI